MTITNGTVEFTRRVTTGDYQHKDAKVSLTFVVGDQEDAVTVLEYVGNRAVERALLMVGEKVDLANVVVPARVNRLAAATIANEHETQATDKGWAGPAAGGAVRSVVDIMGVSAPANPTATAAQPAAEVAQSAAPATASPISDKTLMDHISARNAALITAAGADDTARQLATQRLVKLVDEFTGLPPGPGRVSKIPTERRVEFIERLIQLT